MEDPVALARPSQSRMVLSKESRSNRSNKKVGFAFLSRPFFPVVDLQSSVAFLGIPYAKPPTGNRRLRKPQSLEKGFEGGKYEAKEYSVFVSHQFCRLSPGSTLTHAVCCITLQCPGFGADDWPYELGEDCLTINVVRPTGTTEDSNLPVGFWIYGGGYQQGGSGDRRCELRMT